MARRIISHAEFAGLIGGSRELATGKEGRKGGYYVSRDPRVPVEVGGSEELVAPSHDTAAIKEHFEAMKDIAGKVMPTGFMRARGATKEEQEGIHQGVWSEGGKSYLDVSDRIGKRASESSLREALSRGISQKQLAIWSAGPGKSLSTHIKDEKGFMTVNPAAEKTLGYLNQRQAERAKWNKMSKGAKEEYKAKTLAELSKAAEIHKQSKGR